VKNRKQPDFRRVQGQAGSAGALVADKAFQRVIEMIPPVFDRSHRPGLADQRKFFRQHFGACEIIKRRNDQAFGEVTGGAEKSPWRRDRLGWTGAAMVTRSPAASELNGCGHVLLRSVLHGSSPLRFLGTWLGIDGLLTFDMTAETEAHGREHLFSKGVLLPRTEAGIERGREHVRRDCFQRQSLPPNATALSFYGSSHKEARRNIRPVAKPVTIPIGMTLSRTGAVAAHTTFPSFGSMTRRAAAEPAIFLGSISGAA
jgi:hypothetical protein